MTEFKKNFDPKYFRKFYRKLDNKEAYHIHRAT